MSLDDYGASSKFDIDDLLSGGGSKAINGTTILTPIISTKFTQKENLDKVKVKNMRSLVDDAKAAVNMRSIILMDNEPLHFL